MHCLLLIACLLGLARTLHIRSVQTPFGVLNGETLRVGADLPAVTEYLGVPYGVSPTGQYRFNMAISAAKWTHQPKDAIKNAPVCVQSGFKHMSETEALKRTTARRFDFNHRVLPYLKPQSEDCLYMNIYVPEKLERQDSSPMAVLVVVHGSEYGWGTGNIINGSMLAAFGQIVVVTVNYRLDVYGFLSRCESNSCTGNAGLTDLVAALKMLSNTLPSLGADPQAITLLGWGSGASLISLLMASPITQPKNRLFRRAVLLDGSALCPWALSDYPQQYFMKLAHELQCTTPTKNDGKRVDLFDQDVSQVLRCIQNHSQNNLTLAAQKIKPPTFTSAFAPIVDGQVIPNHPKFSFSPKFGALFRDIDLMVGTVTHPAHHYLNHNEDVDGMTAEKRNKIVRTLVRNIYDYHRTEVFDAILNEYTNWDLPTNHSRSIRDSLMQILDDVLYVTPLIETLRAHSTDEAPKAGSSYFFVFAHETKSQDEITASGIRGAFPEEHVGYIFGFPLFTDSDRLVFTGYSERDRDMAKVMMTYTANFVKTGDPDRPQPLSTQTTIEDRFHSTPWPKYNQGTRESYLEISDRPRIRNYYRNSFVGFWSSYIPRLSRANAENDRTLGEDHHFLPDHFNRQSFYGVVRPYSNFHNLPFPPPPMPPTPLPKDLKKLITTSRAPASSSSAADATKAQSGVYNTALMATVCVGMAFLVVNLCVYLAMYKNCNEQRSSKKQQKYQSYTTGPGVASEVTYIPSGAFGQQSRDETSRASSFAYDSSMATSVRHHPPQPHGVVHNGLPRRLGSLQSEPLSANNNRQFSLHEQLQEPLLAGSSKSSTPALVRTGVSPTCPRHGRNAQFAASQQSRANSVISAAASQCNNTPQALEEVQV